MPLPSPRQCAVGAVVLGCAGAVWAEYPGTMVYDSLVQLREARSGFFSFWHPPIMSWLLRLSDRATGGQSGFVLAQMLIGFAALIGVLTFVRRVHWMAIPAALLICLMPQIFMYQGYVLKDVLLADAVLAGFCALGLAARFWARDWVRWSGLGSGALFLVLATLARQNGILFLPFATVALAWISHSNGWGWRKVLMLALGFAVLAVAGVMTVNAAFARYGNREDAVIAQFKILRLYDLTGMKVHHPDLRLPILEAEAPALATIIAKRGVLLYTPKHNDTLAGDPEISATLEETETAVLDRQWHQTVQAHPIWWLAQRAEIFEWLFWPTHVESCHPFYVGVRGAAQDLQALGMKERNDARDKRLFVYASTLKPVFSHGLFAMIDVAALIFLLIRRRPEDLAIAGLLGGTLAFVASFFAIAIACDYRYLYVLDLAAMAAALYWAADPSTKKDPAPASRQRE